MNRVSNCFVKAFQKEPKSTFSSFTSPELPSNITLDMQSKNGSTEIFIFEVSLEIKEDDGKVKFKNMLLNIVSNLIFFYLLFMYREDLYQYPGIKISLNYAQMWKNKFV